jgi:hypothetical protein
MSNKTAIQELKEYFEQQLRLHKKGEIKFTTEKAFLDAIQICQNAYNTKEKKQIKNAYSKALSNHSFYGELSIHKQESEKYYNETFQND